MKYDNTDDGIDDDKDDENDDNNDDYDDDDVVVLKRLQLSNREIPKTTTTIILTTYSRVTGHKSFQ